MRRRIYKEEDLVFKPAINWMVRNWGYAESFDDKGATGARMDSAGTLNGRALLIEVKYAVNKGSTWFNPAKGGLESKISSSLLALHGGEEDLLSNCFRDIWNPQAPPVIGILAAKYSSAGHSELVEMLTVIHGGIIGHANGGNGPSVSG